MERKNIKVGRCTGRWLTASNTALEIASERVGCAINECTSIVKKIIEIKHSSTNIAVIIFDTRWTVIRDGKHTESTDADLIPKHSCYVSLYCWLLSVIPGIEINAVIVDGHTSNYCFPKKLFSNKIILVQEICFRSAIRNKKTTWMDWWPLTTSPQPSAIKINLPRSSIHWVRGWTVALPCMSATPMTLGLPFAVTPPFLQ